MRPAILRPEAIDDLRVTRDWYEEKQPGLGSKFLNQVSAALRQIQQLPEAPAVVYRNVRFVAVRKFPYGVYYQVLDRQIDIIAIVHGRRASRIWKSRLK